MALERTGVKINFQNGLDLKNDPNQIPIGKFLKLENGVFDKVGRLTKRFGFPSLTTLPDTSSVYVTTFNDNLTAIGDDLKALNEGTNTWYRKGYITPVDVSVLPLVNNSINQIYADSAVSPNGLVCVTYIDQVPVSSGTQNIAKYAVLDATTGQAIVNPRIIPNSTGTVSFNPRVFTYGNYFVLAFAKQTSSAPAYNLSYYYFNSYNVDQVSSVNTFSNTYFPTSAGSFDGGVAGSRFFLSWTGSGSSELRSGYLSSINASPVTAVISSSGGDRVSVAIDSSVGPTVYSAWSKLGVNTGVAATDINLGRVFDPATSGATIGAVNIAPVAVGGVCTLYYETSNSYSFSTELTNIIGFYKVNTSGSFVVLPRDLTRGLGLASKAFAIGSQNYFMTSYSSTNQKTYFLMNSAGGSIAKLAYGNGIGYLTKGLPSVTVIGSVAQCSYLVAETIDSLNRDATVSSVSQNIYSEFGVNQVSFNFNKSILNTTEVAGNLHLNGGFVWSYDGQTPVEHGFHVFPEPVSLSTSTSSGLAEGTYFYQAIYEWSDNQGTIFRSAPSITQKVVLGATSGKRVTVNVPTLRNTYKTLNAPKIVIYRYSAAQPVYYQVTSVQAPLLNDPSVDSVSFLDSQVDSQIVGNNILYTNGGVLENIEPPSSDALTQWDSRVWTISGENPNLLFFSKEIVQDVPAEFSDQLTVYISPSTAAQGYTGPVRAIYPMDDKLIIFKKNSIFYINGKGPNSTGANSQYSEPTFVTSTIGCDKQNSIVMTPNGLMFQSDKGIWLLRRDLGTEYVGKDVEDFNSSIVTSAQTIPATNQVRFSLNTGEVLMYDYFVGQWGTFKGISNISSCLYENQQTIIDKYGRVFQERPGTYKDGSNPVLLSFKTGFISLGGLQNYQRAYETFMLGEYLTPHRLTMGVAYDYDESIRQLATIVPNNYSGSWGSSSTWGAVTTWGGNSRREQWQINFKQQLCQSIQLSFQEYYDGQYGLSSGAGLTISGLDTTIGVKKGYPKNIAPKNQTS